MDQKLVPDPSLNLVNNPKQPLHARNSFKKKIFWKRIIKRPLKSQLYFFFWTQSLLMDKVIKNKRSLELVTNRTSAYERSSEKFLYQLYIIWPSLMMLHKAIFELFQNYICKFTQANSWHHKWFHFHLSFFIWKVWKGMENITKTWISRERNSFLDEINIFNSFWRAIIWWKSKKLIKNSRPKL